MIRTALIGLGRIGWSLEKDRFRYHPCTHAGALQHLGRRAQRPLFELAGVCDHNEEKIALFRRWWGKGLSEWNTDSRKLLESIQPDLVVIATPPETHAQLAVDAIRAGARAVLIEKPVALRTVDVKRLRAEAAASGTVIWVNFERRFHPGYRKVRSILRSESLGPVRRVSGQVLTGGQSAGMKSSPLLHDAIHWVDLLIWMLGAPEKVKGTLRASEGALFEHTALVEFMYPGFSAFLESGGRRKYFEFAMQIDFENGRIRCGNDGHYFYQSAPSRRYQGFSELTPFRVSMPEANPWLEMYKELARAVKNSNDKDVDPLSFLDDALAGLSWIEKLLRQKPELS